MVAVAILAIGIFGVGMMLQVSMHYDSGSNKARTGDAVAKEIIEQLKGDIASTRIEKSVANLALIKLTRPEFCASRHKLSCAQLPRRS